MPSTPAMRPSRASRPPLASSHSLRPCPRLECSQLTDHVAVTNTGEPAADTQSSATAAGVSPPQLQAAAGFSSTPQHSGDNHLQHVHSGPPPPAAAPAGPATVSAVAPQLEQQAVASAPAGLAMPFPRGTTPQQQMHALISACEFQENQEAVSEGKNSRSAAGDGAVKCCMPFCGSPSVALTQPC